MKTTHSQRRRKRWLGGTVLLFSPLFIWGLRNMKASDFTSNLAQTSPENSDPNLRTRFYPAPQNEVTQTVRNLVPTLRTLGQTWKIVASSTRNESDSNDAVKIRCEVPVLVFTDDLTVSVFAESNRTRVDVHSQSRVGKGDFGENRRHVAQLLQALDLKLDAKS